MRKSIAQFKKKVFAAAIAVGALALVNPAYANQLGYDRVIDLEGTSNTRDLGGYLTEDQRMIRSGQLIRSENLHRLTASDFEKLEELGVKTVIDLRTVREHDREPTVWQGDNPPQFHHFPIGDHENDWFRKQSRMIKQNRFSAKQSREHMVEGYRMIADEGTPSYEKLMEVVLDESNWPILFHCNAGKDRAGVATTLILEAVGVDREVIMEEFLLTNELARTGKKAEFIAKQRRSAGTGRFSKAPSAEAWFPIIGVQSEMLEAFYASVEADYGSMDDYLSAIGVDEEDRQELAASLTMEAGQQAMGE